MLVIVGPAKGRAGLFKAAIASGQSVARVTLPGFDAFAALADVHIHDASRDDRRHDSIVNAVLRLNESSPVSGVLTVDEKSVPLTARLAKSLGLPGISAEAAIAARDKATMRSVLESASVRVPRWKAVESAEHARAAAVELGPPVVVKPADNAGSSGVVLVQDAAGVDRAYAEARSFSASGSVLIEEFVEGPEFTVDSISHPGGVDVVAICGKGISEPPYFVELSHWYPAEISSAERRAIEGEVSKAVRAIGIDVGGSHTEIRLTKRGPVVIELAARLGGDQIPEVVRLASGIDLYAAAIDVAMGLDPGGRLVASREGSAGSLMITAPPGEIEALPDLVAQAGRSPDGLFEIHIDGVRGQQVSPLRHNGHTLGWISLRASSVAEVRRQLAGLAADYAIKTSSVPLT